jgi:uncharacterized membrane protein
MLGDIYFESGQLDQAKHHYDAVAGDSSSAKEQAQGRLTAMQDGSIPAAEIARFRSGVGSNCTMCHAQ